MKKINTIKIIPVIMLFVMSLSVFNFFVSPVRAQLDPWNNAGTGVNIQSETGLGDTDPVAVTTNIINIILGFLGMIAVILILLGGFKWMTAAGNEDKIAEAKKLLAAGLIGLIIILMAYGLAKFVIDQIMGATGL